MKDPTYYKSKRPEFICLSFTSLCQKIQEYFTKFGLILNKNLAQTKMTKKI